MEREREVREGEMERREEMGGRIRKGRRGHGAEKKRKEWRRKSGGEGGGLAVGKGERERKRKDQL